VLARPRAGNLLVMIGGNPATGLTSVRGGGATWARAARSLQNAGIEVWLGVTDGSEAAVTIEGTFGVPMWMAVGEWSGLATTGTLDAARAAGGTTNPARAGSIATISSHDLLVFAVANDGPGSFGVPAPGSWIAMPPGAGSIAHGAWYRIADAAGSYMPEVSAGGGSWDAALVALRSAP
jgi:hypothetical protein